MNEIQVTIIGIDNRGKAVAEHGWYGVGLGLKYQMNWFQKQYPAVVRMLVDIALNPVRHNTDIFVGEEDNG